MRRDRSTLVRSVRFVGLTMRRDRSRTEIGLVSWFELGEIGLH